MTSESKGDFESEHPIPIILSCIKYYRLMATKKKVIKKIQFNLQCDFQLFVSKGAIERQQ